MVIGRDGRVLDLGPCRIRLPDSRTVAAVPRHSLRYRRLGVRALCAAAADGDRLAGVSRRLCGGRRLGVLSHVPAGLGVFETVIVAVARPARSTSMRARRARALPADLPCAAAADRGLAVIGAELRVSTASRPPPPAARRRPADAAAAGGAGAGPRRHAGVFRASRRRRIEPRFSANYCRCR